MSNLNNSADSTSNFNKLSSEGNFFNNKDNRIPYPGFDIINKEIKETSYNLNAPLTNININSSSNQIINNQKEVYFVNSENIFKTNPVFFKCPSCYKCKHTRVEKNVNLWNVALCVVTHPVVWLVHQSLKNKEYSCMDAQHYCSECNYPMYNYKAC